MKLLAQISIALVAIEHLYILVLEMFLWNKPIGRRAFGTTQAYADDTKKLAMNQGLYNGFLAAGLLWALWRNDTGVAIFFLICVVVAGLFGGLTTSRKILWIQALPAALALLAVTL